MSRENYFLPLRLDLNTEVKVMVHNIEYLIWDKKSNHTSIFMMNGTEIKVIETPEAIMRSGEKYGVIRELK